MTADTDTTAPPTTHRVTFHTTIYAPWEEGADEREVVDRRSSTYEVDREPGESLAEATHRLLASEGIDDYSASEVQPHSGWFSQKDPYEHPGEGTLEEVTAHLDGFSPEEHRKVYDRTILLKRPAKSGVRMLTDAEARVAASHWQSPGTGGHFLASLASSGYVAPEGLEHEIDQNLRYHRFPNSVENLELTELRNYVRVTGRRTAQPNWGGVGNWAHPYEEERTGNVQLRYTDTSGHVRELGSYRDQDAAWVALLHGQGQSVHYALTEGGYSMTDLHTGEDLGRGYPDQSRYADLTQQNQSKMFARPARVGSWGRKEYEPLAALLATRPDRQELAEHFGRHLVGTNPHFDRGQFQSAAGTIGYRVRSQVRAEPKFTRSHMNLLAHIVREYEGDRDELGYQLAAYLETTNPRFRKQQFLDRAGVRPQQELRVKDESGQTDLDFPLHFANPADAEEAQRNWSEKGFTVTKTSEAEDEPRDGNTATNERNAMTASTDAPGVSDVVGLPSALVYSEELVSWAETAGGTGLEKFIADLEGYEVSGDGVDKFKEAKELMATVAGLFQEGHDALEEQIRLRQAALDTPGHGNMDFIEGQ